MPIYEYQCQECGHELEAIQRLADDPLTECPACAKPGLKKRVSAPSFRLAGGGWYETDFKTGERRISRENAMTLQRKRRRVQILGRPQAMRRPSQQPNRRPLKRVIPPQRAEGGN